MGLPKKNQAPRSAEPDVRNNMPIAGCQRPKNNHNRIITGIGTPNSQSKIPRPIIASLNASWIQERGGEDQVPASAAEKTLTNVRCSA
jgi:hypothetical protein